MLSQLDGMLYGQILVGLALIRIGLNIRKRLLRRQLPLCHNTSISLIASYEDRVLRRHGSQRFNMLPRNGRSTRRTRASHGASLAHTVGLQANAWRRSRGLQNLRARRSWCIPGDLRGKVQWRHLRTACVPEEDMSDREGRHGPGSTAL